MSFEAKKYHTVEEAAGKLQYPPNEKLSPYPELNPQARVEIEGGASIDFPPEETNSSPRVPRFTPPGVEEPEALVVDINGYMMSPTAMMTDETLGGECGRIMEENRAICLGYAHHQRGKLNVETKIGRVGVKEMVEKYRRDLREILEKFEGAKVILRGHSQGGQFAARVLKNPEIFGIDNKQIIGAILMNSMPIPGSKKLWKGPKALSIIKNTCMDVMRAVRTGKGINFNEQQAKDFFFNGEVGPDDARVQRILGALNPGEGLYFLQALLSLKGTSPSFGKEELKGKKIAVISGKQDHLSTLKMQEKMAKYLERAGADVDLFQIMGGHFSPILGGAEANQANAEALKKMFS